jgi:hypothetical protein
MQITYTITLADGSILPKFITFVQSTTVIKFTVTSKSNIDVGSYSLMLLATLSPITNNGQSTSLNVKISLTVTASIPTVNYPP